MGDLHGDSPLEKHKLQWLFLDPACGHFIRLSWRRWKREQLRSRLYIVTGVFLFVIDEEAVAHRAHLAKIAEESKLPDAENVPSS